VSETSLGDGSFITVDPNDIGVIKVDSNINRFVEVLVEDSWRGFPLVRALLKIALTSQACRGNILSEVLISLFALYSL